MKRLSFLFLLLSFFLLSTSVIAQSHQIGLFGGVNLAKVDVDIKDGEQQIETNNKAGFALGGVVCLSLANNIALQIEPAYMQKGSKVIVEWLENGSSFKMDQTFKTNYIDIPLLLKVSLGQGNTRPYLLAGGSIAFKTGDAKVKVDKVTVDGRDVTSLLSSEEREIEWKIKSTDFGLNFGAGVIFPVATYHLFLEGQYNLGLTNINDEDNADEGTLKTKGIQIKAGLLFSLGR